MIARAQMVYQVTISGPNLGKDDMKIPRGRLGRLEKSVRSTRKSVKAALDLNRK